YKKVKQQLTFITDQLKQNNIKLWIRPETTGKATQFGSYQEIIQLSQEIDQVLPCIDFAHLHARTQKLNSYDEFHKVLSDLEAGLGKTIINSMHIHMAGIEYSAKGERWHLELRDSDMKYKELLKVLKEFNAKGVVISESPNIEDDAILMQKFYNSL
ncbi:TIM barrel protein, partial [Nanoarchaeota archaeon]